jgi:eukaryotic-like serine/threonine-protein kinase
VPDKIGVQRNGGSAMRISDVMRELHRRPRELWLDLVRADQSDRWREGAGVTVEEYFSESPELASDTEEMLVLICGEIQLRRERGEQPNADEYRQRFPALANEIALQFEVSRILDDGRPGDGGDGAPDDFESPRPMPELTGYEFLKRIGGGGSGIVFLARQVSLDRYVAIKVLPMPGADAKRLARQRQEAEILAHLRHPNVVHVYEVVEQDGCLYLVMEYVEGSTLKEVAAGKPLTANKAARIVLALSDTMQAVHEAGVLHRDLKPSNVLVPRPDQIRITDFGLAKLTSGDSLLTTEDSVLGTPSYMSPEQALGGAQIAGPQTDVYSLGAVLYELLTGRPPFLGATVLETLSFIREQNPVSPRQLRPRTPSDLETICLHCLKKSPQNRYSTAGALADDLRRFLAGEPVIARRTSHAERLVLWCRRNPMVATLTGAVAILLVAAVVILTASNASIRHEAAAKDAALVTAREAVHQMLMQVANDKLNNMPLGHPLREALLENALQFYEGLLPQTTDDAALREEIASALCSMGCIQRELGRFDDAVRSFKRSREMLETLVAADPQPPRIREKAAAAEEALAYTWKINPAASAQGEADLHFRRTLQMYEKLEHDWPDRRQPLGLCLRELANSAFRQGNLKEAEQLWREAIATGEAFLGQQTENIDARSGVCWACADLADSILIPAENRAAEAEPILQKGLSHVATMQQQSPRSSQAREVEAYLKYCLAQCYSRTERVNESVGLYQQSVDELEAICAEFPWNRQYWDLVQHVNRQAVSGLQSAGRTSEAQALLQRMVAWVQKVGPHIPDDPLPQSELRRCRSELAQFLRSSGHEADADELERALAADLPSSQPSGNASRN